MSTSIVLLLVLFMKCGFSFAGCAPMRFDIGFYLVRDIEVSKTDIQNQVNFAKAIVNAATVGFMQTRFSCHVYGSTSAREEIFDFVSKTSKDGVLAALDAIPTYISGSGVLETIENIRYIWKTIYTVDKGDRAAIEDHCIMMASGENNDTFSDAGYYKPGSFYLRIIDAQKNYEANMYYTSSFYHAFAEYRPISSFSVSSLLTTEVEDFTSTFFTCNYYCDDNYFAYNDPELLKTYQDSDSGRLYLLADGPWNITCCGVITSWIFYAKDSGTLKMCVFRPTGTTNQYKIVGYTIIIVPETSIDTLLTHPNIVGERIAIKEGDKIGWYSSGPNIISYSTCDVSTRTDCPQSNYWYSPTEDIAVGDIITMPTSSDLMNRAYSLKFTTANNTEFIIRTSENETELEENTAVGVRAIYLTIVDTDAYEDYVLTMTGATDYFEINTEKMTIDLNTKFPKGGGGPYIVTISGEDTCQHSATVTLTIGTYNAPPIINNLPYIHEILETTKTAVPLFMINVTDVTNDEVCCTLSSTLPNSLNFVLHNITNDIGVEELWLYTIEEPVFQYSDTDSYRLFVCCEDPYGSTYSYLILRLVEVKQASYVPPGM